MNIELREGPEDPDWVPKDPNIKAIEDIARCGGVGWWSTEIDPETGLDRWLIFQTPQEVEYRIDLLSLNPKELWRLQVPNLISDLWSSICRKAVEAKTDLAFSRTFMGVESPEIDPIDDEEIKSRVNFTMSESFSAGSTHWYKGFDKLLFKVNEIDGKPLSIEARAVAQMQICVRDKFAFLRFKRFSTDSKIVIRYANKTRAFNIYRTLSHLFMKAETKGHGLIPPVL